LVRGDDPVDVARSLLDVSKYDGIKDWVVRDATGLFREANAGKVFVAQITEWDPTASLLPYTPRFIEAAVEDGEGLDLSKFLAALPSRSIPASVVFQYARKVGNYDVSNRVYESRLASSIGEIQRHYFKGELDQAFDLLSKHLTTKAVLWLFAVKDSEFPRLARLIAFSEDLALSILAQIEANPKPFTPQAFILAVLTAFDATGTEADSPLFNFVEQLIFACPTDLRFSKPAIKSLLAAIFTDNVPEPDTRPILLDVVLKSPSATPGFKRAILPSVVAFGFESASHAIIAELGLAYEILNGILTDRTENPFSWIEKHLTDETREGITRVLRERPDPFATFDFEQFFVLVGTTFHQISVAVVDAFQDPDLKHYYIYRGVLEDRPGFGALLKQAVPFICKHYPEQMLPIVLKHLDQDLADLADVFDAHELIECSVTVAQKVIDIAKLELQVKKLITRLPVASVDILTGAIVCLFQRILENHERLFRKLTRCYLLPLSAPDANLPSLRESFRGLMDAASPFLSYDTMVMSFVSVFRRLAPSTLETFVRALLRRQTLSVAEATGLASKLKQSLKHGDFDLRSLHCVHCQHRLFEDGVGIIILACGHAVHNDDPCSRARDCPQCGETK
jgi:hypothetical protein